MTFFSVMPIEAFIDKRLTLEQLRVLGALYSFKPKDSNIVFPRREVIAERCGMHKSNISNATSALQKIGWISKEGKGGHSRATRYTLHVPETVAHSATVADQATVAQSAIGGVAGPATRMPVADPATRKELTSEQTKEGKPSPSAAPIDDTVSIPLEKIRKSSVTFKTFAAACMAAGEEAIPAGDPVFEWAEKARIPADFLSIAWDEFRDRYKDSPKRYSDWRQVFRNVVRDNWYGIWFCNDSNQICLTNKGRLIKSTHKGGGL